MRELPAPESPGAPLDLRALFERYYASTWRLLRRLGVPAERLDDAAQEVFWVAARRLTDIKAGSEHAFLYGVALRVASNERRRHNVVQLCDIEATETLVDHAPSPEEQLDHERALALLDHVLERMTESLRTVFVLFELEGLEVKAIAELEHLPLGTASSRLRRAREEFQAISRRVRAGNERRRNTR